jgi:hypothetical protein
VTVQALRPYADLEGIFRKLEYRASPASPFKELSLEGDSVHQIVHMNDLRLIPRHEFKVVLDASRLKPHYHGHAAALRLVLLTRDSMLRREIVLGSFLIGGLPDVIAIRPEDLRLTGHRDRLPLEFVVVALPVIRGGKSLPTQKASRLARLHVTLANSFGGASFPYKRATVDELVERGLPSETGVHLELLGGAEELIRETDTPAEALFRIWIHEKLWEAIQNDRSRSSAQLRMLAVTETAASLLLSAVIPALRDGGDIEKGSIVGQLLGFVAKQTNQSEDDLGKRFRDSLGLHEVAPYLQAAFRYATVLSKAVDDEESE